MSWRCGLVESIDDFGFPHEVQEYRHSFRQCIDVGVVGVWHNVQPSAAACVRLKEVRILHRDGCVSAAVEKEHGRLDVANRMDGREGLEAPPDRALDVAERQHRERARHMPAEGPGHEDLRVCHRCDGHESRHLRVGCRDEQAGAGADGVSDQKDTTAIDVRAAAKPCQAGLNVLGEAGHRGELVIITAAVAACVEQKNVQPCGAQRGRNGKHVRGAGTPAVA